jgi:NAD(P)-dependent dehydrogenase (short-subunit alcohol dehydrogenase family)
LTDSNTQTLKDKVAIVTGGSQGIGRAVATAYGREGATVVVVNSGNPERGEEVAAEISADGGTAVAMRADVTSKAEVASLVDEVVRRFGTVDILFHGAGVMINKAIEDYTEEDWDRTIDVNLKGSFLMAQGVVPVMKANGHGKIIFIASIAGSVAFPNAVPYCASKGGVVMITKALAAEVAKDGINVNSISPGNTATPLNQHLQDDPEFVKLLETMTPTGRAYIATEEMAGAAVFLASDAASAVHGHDLVVDDGWAAI